MKKQEQQDYLERYHAAKEHGVPFFPDIIFKDVVVSLLIFIVLISLAYFLGIPTEARANPADTTYTPRPEWYFLFLFQLLKYFPGNLEVIGVMVIPTLAILFLVAMPFIDRGPKRHFLNRPWFSLAAVAGVASILTLSTLSVLEAPPPQAAAEVDKAAALYSTNCANCHGPNIAVPSGTDLHKLIAEGKHQGMPAWGGDLSTDEIDALAGFVLSPQGSALYTRECGACHELTVLASGNPLELKRVLDEGPAYARHKDIQVPDWSKALSVDERNALLNFLAAPDGQRLFSINCAGCHGRGVSYSGEPAELKDLISKGGQHLDMPGWRSTLSETDLDTLAAYVVDPKSMPNGATVFGQHCSSCHGDVVPAAPDKDSARKIIASGGGHIEMPVWGQVLTPEQLDALVAYTLAASKGQGSEAGAQLFTTNCAPCHGQFGEGGPNPSRAGDIIAPISSAEYLKTRDDITLRNIIAQGQPNFGMSPFGAANGGPLTDADIDALIAFLRTWQANPPVELPTEVAISKAALTGAQVYAEVCSRCHGPEGEGGQLGPALADPKVQAKYDNQGLFDTISQGHAATAMVGWGDILSQDQIEELVRFIRSLQPITPPTVAVSYAKDIKPLFKDNCGFCHSAAKNKGGWQITSYDTVINSGDNGPAVIAGDSRKSLLAQKVQGVQTDGDPMPPLELMDQASIQLILDWINGGAPNN